MLHSAKLRRVMALAFGTLFASVALVFGDDLRTWSDSSGKFKIEASFVSQDKGKVTLKDKDGKQFEIESAKLCADDQKHLADLAKKAMPENPFKPVGSDKLVTPDWSGVKQVEIVAGAEWKITSNPAPEAQFKSLPVALPKRQNFWEGCSALVVNPLSKRAIVGYQWTTFNPGKPNSRMLYCDLEKGKILSEITMDGVVTPLTIDDEGSQAIFKRTVADKDTLEIWSLTAKGMEKVKEFSPADPKGRGHDARWATFLDKKRLLTASYGGGDVVMWELPTLKPIYQVLTQGSSVPALSHDRKLLAFMTGSQLGILDVDAGKVLAMRPTGNTPWASLAFSPGGKWLACGSHDHVYVWEVATGKLDRDIIVNPLDVWGSLAWPNEKMLLIGNKALMDLDLAYRFWEFKNHNHVQLHGTQGWFVTHEGDNGAIVSTTVPSPAVVEAFEKATPEILLKPGTVVKINVSGLPDEKEAAKVAKALEEQLIKKGCKVGAEGTIELVASADVGKTIEIGFVPATNDGGGRPGMPFIPRFPGANPPKLPPGTKVRIAKLEEHFSRLKFVAQGKTIWESSGDNIPKRVQLEEGQTLEQHLAKLEKPNYAFYTTVDLPRILHRDKGPGMLGSSQISISGVR